MMMMAKRALPSLSIAVALVFNENNTSSSYCDSRRSDNGGTVKEPFTGIEFPRIREDADHTNFLLIGTAVRCMLGQARAYAVGLYVEDAKQAGQWMPKGMPNSSNEIIFSQVLREPIARRLVLVMDKDVAGHHIAKGFDRSLLPRVRRAQDGQKTGPGKDALRDFTRCFNEEKMLRKGTEVSLVWRPGDLLIISINSSVRAVIPSPILCRAVFDMYLGPDSIFKKYRNMSFTLVDKTGL